MRSAVRISSPLDSLFAFAAPGTLTAAIVTAVRLPRVPGRRPGTRGVAASNYLTGTVNSAVRYLFFVPRIPIEPFLSGLMVNVAMPFLFVLLEIDLMPAPAMRTVAALSGLPFGIVTATVNEPRVLRAGGAEGLRIMRDSSVSFTGFENPPTLPSGSMAATRQ